MDNLDKDTIIKIFTALGVIIAAFVTSIIGFYSLLKIKQYENKFQIKKDKTSQKLKFYLPLLRFSYELDGRIGRILASIDTDWLSSKYLEKIRQNEGFAKDPNETGYFIMSSIYMFACFFGWSEAIKKGIDTTKPFSDDNFYRKIFIKIKKKIYTFLEIPAKRNIFLFDPDISTVSKLFQYQELFKDYISAKKLTKPKDACKLHKQFQHSIGELMIEKDGLEALRCKSFREFYEAYLTDEKFRYWFIPLENLLRDLSEFEPDKEIETQVEMKNDIRPLRILAIRYWCRVLMKNMSKELDIETPPPEGVLIGLSESLKKTITSVKIEKLESYLLGIRISNEY